MRTIRIIAMLALMAGGMMSWAQGVKPVKRDFKYFRNIANYDESLVPDYTLPDPLLCDNGQRVESVWQWENVRRPELKALLTTYMYGRAPILNHALPWSVDTVETKALGGKAIRKVVSLQLAERPGAPVIHLQVWLPRKANGPVPLFLGLSFSPNWRIASAPEWQLQYLIDNGFGLATFHYTEACPDKNDLRAWNTGLMPFYYREGQHEPKPDEWGTIALWAWCASRAMDYLQTDQQVDRNRVALIGHSRLGKVTLWAGALDERFSIVFPVNSGCCGAALSRRMIGETPTGINNCIPAWFCGNYKQFSDREQLMPFDQHSVIALVAPRPIYIATASEDLWGDPRGEFLAAKAAESVYALYGEKGIGTEQMPAVDTPYNKGYIAYHIRTGKHAVLPYDWQQFVSYAKRIWKIDK